MKLTPIHPFPARMAPEIVFHVLEGLAKKQVVLDPMSGSGTVLRGASELGHDAIGFDLDPLAVLMAKVWTTRVSADDLVLASEKLVHAANELNEVSLPWIDDCPTTKAYVDFWFGESQRRDLRRIAFLLIEEEGEIADALRIALSRIIVTKGKGASIARDSSHSRPHRVYFENDFNVLDGFLLSAKRLANKLQANKLIGSAKVIKGDARELTNLESESIDVVITSPPYLNAIDYLRGHRLALVWLGHGALSIRNIRSSSIGSECKVEKKKEQLGLDCLVNAGELERLPSRIQSIILRYAGDVSSFMNQLHRVTKEQGKVMVVVGNSCLNGVVISNADINVAAAENAGFSLTDRKDRDLPMASRYLPMPSTGSLGQRMRTETLLDFTRS